MRLQGILLLTLLPVAAATASAETPNLTTVRGLLEHSAKKGVTPAPAPSISVTLMNEKNHLSSPAVTSGKDGMYYIPNVPLGDYTLRVWTGGKEPLTFRITVSKTPVQDIAPVIVDLAPAPPKDLTAAVAHRP